RAAVVLPVGDVVAAAAPGIEQPDPLARGLVEQLAGEGEALAAPADRLAGEPHERLPLAPAAHLARRGAQDARGHERPRLARHHEQARAFHSSSALMRKIGWCG